MESQAPYRTLQPGEMLNWYRIERILGRGGFGVIYLATDTNLDHQVAIKEYIPGDTATRGTDSKVFPLTEEHGDSFKWGMERFIKEARNLVKFKHPNIVRVMSVFQENNTAYMVMEFEEGEDLRSYLRKPGANSEASLKQLILPISKGLAEVHRRGFIHRDIKPANILVRRDGTPVLLDFGSARNASKFTQQNLTALVSVGYAPLEQYNSDADEQQGPWTDIYALGGTLYNAISGKDPVESTRRGAALLNGGTDPLIAAEYLGEGKYSKGFLKAIDWALAFAISDRPQSLSDWIPALLAGDNNANTTQWSDGNQPSNFRADDVESLHDLTDVTQVSEGRPSTPVDYENRSTIPPTSKTASARAAEYSRKTASHSGLRGLAFFTLLLSGVALTLWFITSDHEESSGPTTVQNNLPSASNVASSSVGNADRGVAVVKPSAKQGSIQPSDTLSASEQILKQQEETNRVLNERSMTNVEQKNAVDAAVKESERLTEKTKAAAKEAEAAKVLATQRQAEVEQAKKLAEAEVQKARAREARNAARQAAARKERRLIQAITAAQNSLSVGDLSAAQTQLSNAQTLDAKDPRVETLAFAVKKALDVQNQPVSDADFDSVARMFDGLRRAIEGNDPVLLDRLAISSQQSTLLKSLMKSFERVDVSITNIRVRNADKSISAVLRIDSMIRENGDRATPSDKYATRSIVSRRVNGGWSKIQW